MSAQDLLKAVNRLEVVAARLEKLSQDHGEHSGLSTSEKVHPLVTAYDELINGAVAAFVTTSLKIGGDVQNQGEMVKSAFQVQREFLLQVSKSKQPTENILGDLLKPTADKIQKIQEFMEKSRGRAFFNHLSAVSEAIPALGWVSVSSTPGSYIKEFADAAQFFSNRVLKDYKDKDKIHVEWTKCWTAILTQLQMYVKQFHITGVAWNPQGADITGVPKQVACSVPPPPPPPPPVDMPSDMSASVDDRSALLNQIRQGTEITKGLRKVSDDMKTHKNPALREGPAPFKPVPKTNTFRTPSAAKAVETPIRKTPVVELQDKKWIVEYHNDTKNILISETNIKQTVYIYSCTSSTIHVKGKVNSIVLDSCKKCVILFDDVISSLEFINCQSMKGQVTGVVPTISIDKTDGCMIYLSKDSLQAEVITAKCSEINILIPGQAGEYSEFSIPEQYKSTWNGKQMVTVCTDIN